MKSQMAAVSESAESGLQNQSESSLVISNRVNPPAAESDDDCTEITVTKQEINKALRNPEILLTENARLASEVQLCNVLDDDYGPVSGRTHYFELVLVPLLVFGLVLFLIRVLILVSLLVFVLIIVPIILLVLLSVSCYLQYDLEKKMFMLLRIRKL